MSAPAECASFRVGRGAVQGGASARTPPGAALRGLVQRQVARWTASRSREAGWGRGCVLQEGGAEVL